MPSIGEMFGVGERGSMLGREVLGGVTTFMAFSYTIFLQPAMMEDAAMPLAGARTRSPSTRGLLAWVVGDKEDGTMSVGVKVWEAWSWGKKGDASI